jgi:transposase
MSNKIDKIPGLKEEIETLAKQGYTKAKLAEHFNVHLTTIYTWIKVLGITSVDRLNPQNLKIANIELEKYTLEELKEEYSKIDQLAIKARKRENTIIYLNQLKILSDEIHMRRYS